MTYKSGGKSTKVDYVMHGRRNLKEMCDFKVIVNECVAKQHRMVVCKMARIVVCKMVKTYGEKQKSGESEVKDKMVETEGDKLSRSNLTRGDQEF